MKKIFKEFEMFLARGNAIELAIGIVIGTAFNRITSSLVNDILMPVIGLLTGGSDLSKINICIREAVYNESGEIVKEAINIGFGNFVSTILDFFIISFVIFLLVKAINETSNRIIKKKEEKVTEQKKPTTEELLASILDEIRKR